MKRYAVITRSAAVGGTATVYLENELIEIVERLVRESRGPVEVYALAEVGVRYSEISRLTSEVCRSGTEEAKS